MPFVETVELLARAKAGDSACLGRVLERYRERLLLRVRLLMGPEARGVAESGDFLHGVFVKILEHFDQFQIRDERAFLRWATQIARNGIRNDLSRKREVVLDTFAAEAGLWEASTARGGTPSQAVERAEQMTGLVEALADLPEERRRVVELRHFERLSFAEIGRRLGRSENAVQLLHARALVRLYERLRRAESAGGGRAATGLTPGR